MSLSTDCDRLHEVLDAYLDGTLDANAVTAVDAHLGVCAECRTVVEVVGADTPSIVQAVVGRTTGRVCGQVQQALAAIDPAPASAWAHVDECPACARFVAVLARCERVLPGFAESSPDADFASDVVMATVDHPSLVHVAWRRAVDRWNRWIERPHAAQEMAYAVTIVLVLLTSTPIAPFPDLPERALDVVRSGVEGPRRAPHTSFQPAVAQGPLDGARLRGGRVLRDLDRVGEGLGTAAAGLLTGDPDRVGRGAVEMGCGLESLWLGVRRPTVELDGPCAGEPVPGTATRTPASPPVRGGRA